MTDILTRDEDSSLLEAALESKRLRSGDELVIRHKVFEEAGTLHIQIGGQTVALAGIQTAPEIVDHTPRPRVGDEIRTRSGRTTGVIRAFMDEPGNVLSASPGAPVEGDLQYAVIVRRYSDDGYDTPEIVRLRDLIITRTFQAQQAEKEMAKRLDETFPLAM